MLIVIQAVCTVSPDGSTVATGSEQGQLVIYDLRYFGPPLQEVHLPNVIPSSLPEARLSTTYQPQGTLPRSHDHAIHALAVGQRGMGMGHVLAFQLRGGCRVGLYNILSHNTHLIDFSPSPSCHKLTRGRIAFSHLDSTLFYGDTTNGLQAVNCVCTSSNTPVHSHKTRTVSLDSMVTSVATNAFGVVAVGMESSDVVLCTNSVVQSKSEAKDEIIDNSQALIVIQFLFICNKYYITLSLLRVNHYCSSLLVIVAVSQKIQIRAARACVMRRRLALVYPTHKQ